MPLLDTTVQLLACLTAAERDMEVVSNLMNALLPMATQADADALFDWVVDHPEDSANAELAELLVRYARSAWGAPISEVFLVGNRLKDPAMDFALELIGHTGYAPALPALLHYALEDTTDHYRTRAAVFGLLPMDCTGHETAILRAIEATYDQSLFPEFVPALVCKLPEREFVLPRLYDTGHNTSSTDCNGGILLGFALCGEVGMGYFQEALFEEAWEAEDAGTGTAYWVYRGMKVLGMDLIDLYGWVVAEADGDRQAQGLRVLLQMIRYRMKDATVRDPMARLQGFGAGAVGETLRALCLEHGEDEVMEDLLRECRSMGI